jgi:ankyrin repeat protein
LSLSNQSAHDYNFTGCPLYNKMIADVCEMDLERCLNSEVWIQPRIYLVNLYEKFVERKLDIYLRDKKKPDITNSSVLDDHEYSIPGLLINFEKCALAAILPPPMLESLDNKNIEKEIKSFLERVEKGKDKTGIVMNVVEGKPQFVHRTFAEYFTARWFSENFESNRRVLEDILFDPKYSFVRDMFDRMLAKDCPLHCAVLARDVERLKTLLKEGCDINGVDKGGRNVLHIIAKRKHELVHYERYIEKFIDKIPDYTVPFDATDCVLQWTPLQYAIKSERWFILQWLLERNVDRSGLAMITERAHDRDYIGPIIREAERKSHGLLLEFIRSIGVNILQALSMNFLFPLQAAIQADDLPHIRWLIKHGADCNARYSDGQTALHYAVTVGSLNIVRALVEEGGASLDVRDDCGRTAIDWAKYQSLWKDELEKWKEIVKYLEERKCK